MEPLVERGGDGVRVVCCARGARTSDPHNRRDCRSTFSEGFVRGGVVTKNNMPISDVKTRSKIECFAVRI